MALRFTDAATNIRVVQASLSAFSLGVWYRRPTSASGFGADSIVAAAFGYAIVHNTTSLCARVNFTHDPPSPVVQPAAGEWVYIAITSDGGDYILRAFEDETAAVVGAIAADWTPLSEADVVIGDAQEAFGAGLADSVYLHMRVWSSVLSQAQLNAEKNSPTPVITAGLVSAVPFTSSLAATNGTNATVGTGSGYEFIAALPLVLSGGGAAIDPGVILAQLAGAFGPDRGFGFGY